MTLRRRAPSDPGQATVEFALILPLFALLIVALVDVSVIVRDQMLADVLARALGARPWAAWVAGEIFAFNPFTFYQLETGRVIETILFPVPRYALCLSKAWPDDASNGVANTESRKVNIVQSVVTTIIKSNQVVAASTQ